MQGRTLIYIILMLLGVVGAAFWYVSGLDESNIVGYEVVNVGSNNAKIAVFDTSKTAIPLEIAQSKRIFTSTNENFVKIIDLDGLQPATTYDFTIGDAEDISGSITTLESVDFPATPFNLFGEVKLNGIAQQVGVLKVKQIGDKAIENDLGTQITDGTFVIDVSSYITPLELRLVEEPDKDFIISYEFTTLNGERIDTRSLDFVRDILIGENPDVLEFE